MLRRVLSNGNVTHDIDRLRQTRGWSNPFLPDELNPLWFRSSNSPSISTAYSDEHAATRAELDHASWWYQTRNQIICDAIKHLGSKTLWDVGSGTGIVSGALTKAGWKVIGVEPSVEGSRHTARLGMATFCGTLDQLDLPDESLEAVSMFDVLEHVDDREALLKEVRRVLCADGVLVVTVPAIQALWSQFDIDEGHRLRYRKTSLRRELAAAGFHVSRVGYFFSLTILPLMLLRAVPFRLGINRPMSDTREVSVRLKKLGPLATWFERWMALRAPLGSSLIAISHKR